MNINYKAMLKIWILKNAKRLIGQKDPKYFEKVFM